MVHSLLSTMKSPTRDTSIPWMSTLDGAKASAPLPLVDEPHATPASTKNHEHVLNNGTYSLTKLLSAMSAKLETAQNVRLTCSADQRAWTLFQSPGGLRGSHWSMRSLIGKWPNLVNARATRLRVAAAAVS